MSTTTLTLAEFLLARVAEDEVEAPFIHDGDKWSDGCSCDFPNRWLAECEAKRSVIAWVTDKTVICEVADPVLAALALPYADHPDYRAQWRP